MATFKSDTQPHCRCCAKPIKKVTEQHWFGRTRDKAEYYSIEHTAKPLSRAEAQAITGGNVVSVSWSLKYASLGAEGTKDYIDGANVWDGETYQDEFFCTLRCAAEMGRAVAAKGWEFPAYSEVMRKIKEAQA